MAQRTRIPLVGERGRTFGGEFEVVERDSENVVIRWVDDGSTAEFDASVLGVVLESYARALSDDDDLESATPPDRFGIFGTLEEEAADTPCPNCQAPLDAGSSCGECGTLECTTCSACDCMLAVVIDSAGRSAGRH